MKIVTAKGGRIISNMLILRYLLCLLGILLAISLLAIIVLAIRMPVSLSGILYLIAGFLVAAGLIAAPVLPKYYLQITIAGLIGLILIAGGRLILVEQNKSSGLRMITLPGGKGGRWINALIDEQDGLTFGEQFFHRIGGDSDSEHTNIDASFAAVYSSIRKQGNFPSPILSTYLNLQQPDHFDAVMIKPDQQPRFGLVFLHGFMGNVTAQCWVIAQAVKKAGGVTICPSTSWTGEWWRPEGQHILKSTFQYMRDHGIQNIYLGGFSNGGFSIGRLASLLADEKGMAGLIFIDGFMNGASVRELGLPVLILQGTQDERVPVEAGRQFAKEVGNVATYVEINSDHFLIIKQPARVQDEIRKW
ncbi:MAG: alpha/beta hydrolase, partial [Bacteroidota bacterium]